EVRIIGPTPAWVPAFLEIVHCRSDLLVNLDAVPGGGPQAEKSKMRAGEIRGLGGSTAMIPTSSRPRFLFFGRGRVALHLSGNQALGQMDDQLIVFLT